ncbi:MAG: hypothetical protein NTW68_06495 [candidate division NC10 bacterium]|nr:hypothetical protein [candidate division NC10 bacterium]
MGTVYAAEGSTGNAAMLIPYLLMGCILGFLLMYIARRKAKNTTLWFLAGFVPGLNLLGLFWLASLPDQATLEQISALAEKVRKLDMVIKGKEIASPSTGREKWTCTCGNINDMAEPNCPECGLKRDFLLKKGADKVREKSS